MTDGTVLNTGVFGDTIRDTTKSTVTAPGATTSLGQQQSNTTQKTQIVALDLGGASGNAEYLYTVGPALAIESAPVVLAGDQQSLPAERASAFLLANLLRMQIAGPTGFVPVEIPDWMVGF